MAFLPLRQHKLRLELLCCSLATLSISCGGGDGAEEKNRNTGSDPVATAGGSTGNDGGTASGASSAVGDGSGGMAELGGAPGEDEGSGGDAEVGESSGGTEGDESSAGGGDTGAGGDSNEEEPGPPDVGDGGFVRPVHFSDEGLLDLLFVIDNSISMADKQQLLSKAVPQMLQRLTNPDCVDNATHEKIANPGTCPPGYSREARAFSDLHIGVVSSSLGGHGSRYCTRDGLDEDGSPLGADDQGRLIASVRAELLNDGDTAFLAWNGGGDEEAAARAQLIANFEAHVAATGESGCGFEAPLEAWYRFLIDPQPPLEIVLEEGGATMKEGLVDEVVLTQRAAFLRPEGWVAIVVLTDENDCSIMDGGSYYPNASYGYLVSDVGRAFPVATSICEENANDKCCFSCLQATNPPEGCEEAASICGDLSTIPPTLAPENDRGNVRCFDNQRRFGVDLLYPTKRYVDALTKESIVDARSGDMFDNPLLRGVGESQGITRNPGMVFFAGIVGVPWQDLASPQSLEEGSGRLDYLRAVELSEKNVEVDGVMVDRWQLLLGEPGQAQSSKHCELVPDDPACGRLSTPPLDPFMIESIEEREAGQQNPISGDLIVASTSNNPLANAINGHEANHDVTGIHADDGPSRDELQYACTFELETPKLDCAREDYGCDCADEPTRNRPLCQPPEGGESSTSQYYGKAYPGTRILQVLRDFGANSIVGSICPKFATGDPSDLNFGYNPVLQQLVDRVHVWQSGSCFQDELDLADDGSLACAVVEVKNTDDGSLDCQGPGRAAVDNELREVILARLEAEGECGDGTGVACTSFDACAILELEDADREACLYDEVDTTDLEAGFCYIDPAKTQLEGGESEYIAGGGTDGSNAIVSNCAQGEQRMLRFTGSSTPNAGALAYVICDSSVEAE